MSERNSSGLTSMLMVSSAASKGMIYELDGFQARVPQAGRRGEEARSAETDRLEQQPPPAWLNLITVIEANVAEWNRVNERTQFHLNKSAGQISLHHAGQLGSILELHFDPRALVVRYSAPTQQANHWGRHCGELQMNSDGLFVGSPGSEIAKPLTAAEISRFLLKPVLFG